VPHSVPLSLPFGCSAELNFVTEPSDRSNAAVIHLYSIVPLLVNLGDNTVAPLALIPPQVHLHLGSHFEFFACFIFLGVFLEVLVLVLLLIHSRALLLRDTFTLQHLELLDCSS
jgi:hypothetical protein